MAKLGSPTLTSHEQYLKALADLRRLPVFIDSELAQRLGCDGRPPHAPK